MKRISQIVVTRHVPDQSEAQVTDAETGGEIVAMVSADSVVTMDGYAVKVVEIEEVEDLDDEYGWQEILVDDQAAYAKILADLNGVGIPLDKEVIELIIDSYHKFLDSEGLRQWEEGQDE